ncbi:hypothetical protein [Maritalea sp.]|jgi:hypothetical protein|uniref:hypothetical protein n=1 Tax=Maritalea sp. TaxID=2003361 RepID=UPI0039E50314
MIIRPLPHPGFAWGLSQHAAGFDETTIRGMLVCAFPFQGQKKAGPQITDLMVRADLLTPNQRDGRADAWRDYQQILSELGLIVSTKLSAELILTDVSKAFIADQLPFDHMMAMQVLRYQYPNGQKHDRSPALKEKLTASGQVVPDSLIELHSNSGVLVKPGLLILQVLLGLLESGDDPEISADECRAILVPCKTNAEWARALTDIQSARRGEINLQAVHNDRRLCRNIQDWFKLLFVTGLIETDGHSFVGLSRYAQSMCPALKQLSSAQSAPGSFWIPRGHDAANRLTWYTHFGSYDAAFEALAFSMKPMAGSNSNLLEIEDADGDERITFTGPIRLASFDKDKLFNKDAPNLAQSIDELAASVKEGAIKRHAKTVLHDEMVLHFAERFQAQGAEVKVDPNSIDLFVAWSPQETAIFEIKTVSQRSLPQRMRSAVGQVKEYAYRLQQETGIEPEQAIIIDRPVNSESWQRDFLNDYMGIGLICVGNPQETIFAPHLSTTSRHWHKNNSH